jgi:hypothetical protein
MKKPDLILPNRVLSYQVEVPTIVETPVFVAEWTGLEPATPGVTGRYSNQLNYHSSNKARILPQPAVPRKGFVHFFGIFTASPVCGSVYAA